MADSRASVSVENENAFRNLLALAGFFTTPRWFVLMVVIQSDVAVLRYTVAAKSMRGRILHSGFPPPASRIGLYACFPNSFAIIPDLSLDFLPTCPDPVVSEVIFQSFIIRRELSASLAETVRVR